MPQRLGLFGGSFDPIHNGHIALARAFAERLGLDRVLLMPTAAPPHKIRPEMAPAADRLRMCALAAQAEPLLAVSDLELRRGGASFTADTLDELRAEYPGSEWALITGADMFLTIGTWYRYPAIAAHALLCAAPRGAVTLAALRDHAARLEAKGARCAVEDIPVLDISSTMVRAAVRRGEPIDALVPAAVAAYIRERRLYAAPAETERRDMDEQYIEIIRGRLSAKRFAHSLAVADEAARLARRYGADADKAYTAGILHDILKDTPPDAQLQMFEEFGILLDTVEQAAPKLWHARLGAAFIERILGVQDPGILAAVRYHTTARAGMSLLEKVLYLADFTSADRDYPDVDVMRRRVDEGLAPAMAYALVFSMQELLDKRAPIHPDTLAAYNEQMADGAGA